MNALARVEGRWVADGSATASRRTVAVGTLHFLAGRCSGSYTAVAALPIILAMFWSLFLASRAVAATPETAARITGTFSSLAINAESGDLGGMEITIVFGGSDHYAIVQCSEGSPGIPLVAKVQVQGQKISFIIPKGSSSGCPEAAYTGTVSTAGLQGRFAGAGQQELLKRKPSYWQ